MRNYKFIVTYDGSKYSGWQRLQDNIEKSIQGKIEILLSKLLEEEIQIIGRAKSCPYRFAALALRPVRRIHR